jgi:hypothetical protein
MSLVIEEKVSPEFCLGKNAPGRVDQREGEERLVSLREGGVSEAREGN